MPLWYSSLKSPNWGASGREMGTQPQGYGLLKNSLDSMGRRVSRFSEPTGLSSERRACTRKDLHSNSCRGRIFMFQSVLVTTSDHLHNQRRFKTILPLPNVLDGLCRIQFMWMTGSSLCWENMLVSSAKSATFVMMSQMLSFK